MKKPDSFYEDVSAKVRSSNAQQVAAQHRVPLSTVYRWVKEAKRRGVAPPPRSLEDRLRGSQHRCLVCRDVLRSLKQGGELA